ncbi:MAG: amidohydrolase family protein [Ignavibacteriae bacterium]|nr:amidohydrolase family protein [Ignavibacteriota bacterium]
MKITNAWICKINNQSIEPIFGDLVIKDGVIADIIPTKFQDYLKARKVNRKDTYDAGGRVVTVPNVNFHDHIYSRLAKGVPINGPLDDFSNILNNLWWKLDNILDADMIRASANYAVMDSIKNGVTYLFDHHSSPSNPQKSLFEIAKVIKKNNLRGVLAFETTDRNGKAKSLKGLMENSEFFLNFTGQDIKSMFGLHASFTLKDETLKTVSEFIDENNLGIHIHLCEDPFDREVSVKDTGKLPLKRLIDFNLLNEKSILSHSIHITKNEMKQIAKYGSAVAVNIDSNMNNNVGLTKLASFDNSVPIIAGTDGMHSNPTRTLKNAFLLLRNSGLSFDDAFALIIRIYFDQLNFVNRYYQDFPKLNKNDRADFIVWDYIPPTPLNKDNYWGHYTYGMTESSIYGTFQLGENLMWEKKLTNINEEKTFKDIYTQGEKLYKKMKRLK